MPGCQYLMSSRSGERGRGEGGEREILLLAIITGGHWNWWCPQPALVPAEVRSHDSHVCTSPSFPYSTPLPSLPHSPSHLSRLPEYACKFLEICLMVTADHGPAVSGAHNTIITARAGKDLVSSLASGLLTIVSQASQSS